MRIIEYENYHERISRESHSFPYLTYPCSIPLDFKRVPVHWHEEMELIYIKKGRGIVTVDFQRMEVKAGDILLIGPGQLHSIGQLRQETMEYENIIFPLSLLNSQPGDGVWIQYLEPIAMRKKELVPCLEPDKEGYGKMAACIDAIDEIRRSFPEAFPLLIKGKLFEFFFLLYQHGCVKDPDIRSGEGGRGREKAMEKSRMVIRFVEEHYPEPLPIERMADVTGFSQSHFMKFFKEIFGVSFTSYLNDYRLTMASRLLLASGDTILEVATATGFENLSYFNRRFKGKFGMTPREFRGQSLHSGHKYDKM